MLKRLLCYLVLQEWQHKCRLAGINCVIPAKKNMMIALSFIRPSRMRSGVS